jgi:6-phosphogluconolactonase
MAPLAEAAVAQILAAAPPPPHVPSATDVVVFFGTQAEGPQRGISRAYFDTSTGALSPPELVTEAIRPGFLVLSADGRHLYSTNSVDAFKGQPSGAVSAYEVDAATGDLKFLNQQLSGGQNPAHVSLDAAGHHLFVANYNGGSIAVFEINADGSLGARTAFVQHEGTSVHPLRQTKAHAHAIKLDPSGRFALVPDLGADKLFVYRFDPKTGSLAPNNPPFAALTPGSGPRHLAFHPSGRFAYLLNELASSVSVFGWDPSRGRLTELQKASTLPDGFSGTTTAAEIEVHPSGKFLYATNRGHDSLAVFAIDPATGRLSLVEHVPTQGKNPRNFAFDPTGRWLVVTNNVGQNAMVFRIDEGTGRLTASGAPLALPYPFFCLRFLSKH